MQAIPITSANPFVAPAANANCFQTHQFSEQLLALRPNVLRFCLHYLKDGDIAQEVCQEVMLKALKNVGQFEQRSNVKTWLMKIAFNECTTQYRKLKIYAQRYTDYDETDVDLLSDYEEVEEETNARLVQIVASLSASQQTILRYRFVDDLALAEIACLMGVKLSSVKMNYYRALQKIHKLYVS